MVVLVLPLLQDPEELVVAVLAVLMLLEQTVQQTLVAEVAEVADLWQMEVPVVPVLSSSHILHKTSRTLLKLSQTPPQGPTRHRIISR